MGFTGVVGVRCTVEVISRYRAHRSYSGLRAFRLYLLAKSGLQGLLSGFHKDLRVVAYRAEPVYRA